MLHVVLCQDVVHLARLREAALVHAAGHRVRALHVARVRPRAHAAPELLRLVLQRARPLRRLLLLRQPLVRAVEAVSYTHLTLPTICSV